MLLWFKGVGKTQCLGPTQELLALRIVVKYPVPGEEQALIIIPAAALCLPAWLQLYKNSVSAAGGQRLKSYLSKGADVRVNYAAEPRCAWKETVLLNERGKMRICSRNKGADVCG